MAPSAEIFPGGSYEDPWTAGVDDEELDPYYEAGGAAATVEGEGTLALALDGERRDPLEVRPGALRARDPPAPRGAPWR